MKRWRLTGNKIVFTNGVFDIIHEGHLASLNEAAGYGNILIVAVNADSSVKKLKGDSRPIFSETIRLQMLASLMVTDAVILFAEDTPADIIKVILPDVLVKGGDYKIENIAGAKAVIDNGGMVILGEMVKGVSTTKIIETMK